MSLEGGREGRGWDGRGGERRGGEGMGGREGSGREGRAEGEGERREGGREGRDDCYTYTDGTTIFIQSRHVLRNNVSQHSIGSTPFARRTMVRNYVRRDVNSRTESQIKS